jgi:hypothetical protein
MKSCFLCLILFLSIFFSIQTFVPYAIREIIRDFYVNQSENFDFIIYGADTVKLGQLVTDIVKVKSGDAFAYKLIQVHEGKEEVWVYRSAILLFDTFNSYQDFHARAHLASDFNFKLLVYIIEFEYSSEELYPAPRNLRMFSIETFMTQNFRRNSLNLTTFLKFQQPNCRDFVTLHVNKFSTSEMKWETQDYFIEKFKNYNGCQLVVVIPFQRAPYTEVSFDQYGNINGIRGAAVDIHWAISKKLNYTLGYNFFNIESKSLLYPGFVDFELTIQPMRQLASTESALIQPIISVDSVIIASRSPTYSNFERVFMPFEHEVWICLTVTIAVSVITIVALKLTPKKVQDFVIGSEVSTPLLSFLYAKTHFSVESFYQRYILAKIQTNFFVFRGASLGGSHLVLPTRNFARFILMNYLLFSLVLRSAYLGKQFEFMQKEMRKPGIDSIDEMIQENYTLYVYPESLRNSFADMEFMKR